MTHDERLVEAMAQRMWRRHGWREDSWDDFADQDYWRSQASEELNAINASGIAWVAPWEATDGMQRAGSQAESDWGPWVDKWYAAMRDAHLAEQGEKE